MNRIGLSLAFLSFTIYPIRAEEVGELELSLRHAVYLAVKNNLEIRISRLDPDIAQDGVVQELAGFDPIIQTSLAGGKARQQTGTQLAGAEVISSDKFDAAIGVRKRYEAGSVLSTDLSTRREGTNSLFSSFKSANSAVAAVTLSQPLLKGRGESVNLAGIRISTNLREQSLHQFRKVVELTVARTEQSYWDLVFATRNLEVQKTLLAQARSLHEHVRDLADGGTLTQTDVTQARAGVASREENIILAEQSLRNVEDGLKELISMLTSDSPDDLLITTSEPSLNPRVVQVNSAIGNALKNRPEYSGATLELQNRNIAIVVARNARYPQLNLQGSFSLNGLTGSYGNTLDSVVSTDFYEWNVGVTLELPIGFRAARSTYKRSQSEKAQSLLRLKQLEQQIVREVRVAARQVVAAQKRIKTTDASMKLQREKLEGEQDKLTDGRSTPQEVLDFQVDFAIARINHLRSVIDYQKSMVELDVAQGILLESKMIEVVENQIIHQDN